MDEVTGEKQSSTSRISQLLLGVYYCHRYNVFSAHVKPSSFALRHRENLVSLIYAYGLQKVRAHVTAAEPEEEEWNRYEEEKKRETASAPNR